MTRIRSVTRPLVAALVIALSAGATACACPGPYEAFEEYFEYCDGTCGWSVSGAGTAARVTTIHPGEHGLRLEGGVDITRNAGGYFDYYDGQPTVELVSNCDGELRVWMVAQGESGYALVVQLPTGPERYDGGGYQLLVAPMPEPVSEGGYTPDSFTLESFTIVNQQGICVVDEIRIMMPAPPCYG